MAIAQAMCTAFKQELMLGTHNFATNGMLLNLLCMQRVVAVNQAQQQH